MKPIKGKTYQLKYIAENPHESYEGPGICLGRDKVSWGENWLFKLPGVDVPCLFREEDVVSLIKPTLKNVRKLDCLTVEEHFNLPKGSFAKFVEENAEKLP